MTDYAKTGSGPIHTNNSRGQPSISLKKRFPLLLPKFPTTWRRFLEEETIRLRLKKRKRAATYQQIKHYYSQHRDEFEAQFPGLKGVLRDASKGKCDAEDYNRRVLLSIKAQPEFDTAFNELDEDLKEKLLDFMSGKSANEICKHGFATPLSPAVKRHLPAAQINVPQESGVKEQGTVVIYDDEQRTKPIPVHVNMVFENWGKTVANTPSVTLVPTTVIGVKNIVRHAIDNNKRVRVGGFRHTWSNMYSEDDQIFVSLLDLENATAVPSIAPKDQKPIDPANDFKRIELAPQDLPGSNGKKRWVRIGAAVTNEEFRQWSIKNGWTLPLNVIMVEITFGGSNVPICHGAGIANKTLSDLVRSIEYVDANAQLQVVSDPEHLKAAAGSFGLLGVITNITLELDKMTYAHMYPLKQDVNLAIPPPPGFKVPKDIRANYSEKQLEKARKEFIDKVENSYYSEWFWFPYQQNAWVNCWKNTEDSKDVIDYPTDAGVYIQWAEGWLGGVINDCELFQALPGKVQATVNSTTAMTALPPHLDTIQREIKTYMIDALHFRRGVQNMRVRDLEIEIPIPPLASDPSKPDWGIVQRAWWDAIEIVYNDDNAPMRTALELRIMGDSDIIMAPQRGNKFGTASIEVLTTMAAVDVWDPFVQKIIDKWMSYKDPNGNNLNIRPHWAKEWDGYKVGERSFKDHLKEVSYKEEIPKFTSILADIGKIQKWTLDDIKARFSNSFFDYLFFSETNKS